MTVVASFSNSVYDYIHTQYGKDTLSVVKSEKNKSIVSKLIESSIRQDNDIVHAANKIVAMLRVNP